MEGKNLVYPLLYPHHLEPLVAQRRAQQIFAERRKREGKKQAKKPGSKEGRKDVRNECNAPKSKPSIKFIMINVIYHNLFSVM